jgi:hypothetical protein
MRASAWVWLWVCTACGDPASMDDGETEPPPMNVHIALHNVSASGALVTSDGGATDIVLSSGIVVAQLHPARLFEEGASAAGTGLEALAEDGQPDALEGELAGDPEAFPIVMRFAAAYGAGENGDLLDPGNTLRIDLTAPPEARVAFAMMFAQSNDTMLATVPEGIAIDEPTEERDITSEIALFDVGTEVSEEPGLGSTQAPRQAAPNTGTDEAGTITRIQGTDASGVAYPEVSSFLSATVRIDTEPPID